MPLDGQRGPIVVHLHDLSPVREQFTHTIAVSRSWVLLTAVDGSYSYTLTPPAGVSHVGDTRGPVSGRCSAGEMVICPPDVIMDRSLDEPSRWWFAEFDLVATGLDPWWPVGPVTIGDRQRLRSNVRQLDEATTALREPRLHHLRTHLVLDMLMLIDTEQRRAAAPPDEAVARATTLLEQLAPDPDASIHDVASAVNLSPTQFTRRFGATHGVPPVRYLTELRMSRAQRLLLDTDESVTAIADACGYRSPFYFSRVFRRFTGRAPVDFRRTHRV